MPNALGPHTIAGVYHPRMTMPLGTDPCMTDLLDRLLVSVDSLTDELTAEILNGERSYAEGMLLSHEQLRAPVHDNLCTLLAALKNGGVPTSMDAPRAAGLPRPNKASRWPLCCMPSALAGGSSGTGCWRWPSARTAQPGCCTGPRTSG